MEWRWNGNGMEKEWKIKDKLSGTKYQWNGMERERKWNGKCG